MEYQPIKTLLDRYFRGETSVEEENILSDYFTGDRVDDRLRTYAPLFQWTAEERKQSLEGHRWERLFDRLPTAPVKYLNPSSRSRQWLFRVAAVLVLTAGIWWAYSSRQDPLQTAEVDWSKYEITDEQEALEITRGALFKASKTLNEGARAAAGQMDRMQEIGKFFK